MKTSKIGTIMPWAGDGNEGDLLSNIPKGWILCDGTVHPASRYPLLTSLLGNSYGGSTITGDFPHYTGTCKVPDISTRCMMDLEPAMLNQAAYQYGQSSAATVVGNLVSGDGLTTSIPTLISADTDLAFNPLPSINLVGKMTNITLNPPSFQTTVSTVARKLGINHMPYHNHGGTYNRASAGAAPPDVFSPSSMQIGGSRPFPNSCGTGTWNTATFTQITNAETWCNGRLPVTFYDENTLISTDKFYEFTSSANQDYSGIPANTAQARPIDSLIYTGPFSSIPVKTHREATWEGLFPRPMEFSNRRNYFGLNTGVIGSTGLQDDPESVGIKVVGNVTIVAGQTTVSLPAGTLIGTNYTQIVPLMFVKSASTTGTFMASGTQVLSVSRLSGSSTADYVYQIELSEVIGGAGSTTTQLSFRHGTYPTTLNSQASAQDPATFSFGSHNHASFDITMNVGSLSGPSTHPINDMSIGNVAPETISGALNIIANIANPSLNVVYLIRAY